MFEKLRHSMNGVERVHCLIGETIFSVLIDDTPRLQLLQEEARNLRGRAFPESAEAVTAIALRALGRNAVEFAASDPEARHMVYETHSLGEALAAGKACCRYQAALFFALAFEARLGTSHALLTKNLGRNASGPFSVYNKIFGPSGDPRVISIYNLSLSSDAARSRLGYPDPGGRPAPGWDFSGNSSYHAYVVDADDPGNDPVIIKARGSSPAMDRWSDNLALA